MVNDAVLLTYLKNGNGFVIDNSLNVYQVTQHVNSGRQGWIYATIPFSIILGRVVSDGMEQWAASVLLRIIVLLATGFLLWFGILRWIDSMNRKERGDLRWVQWDDERMGEILERARLTSRFSVGGFVVCLSFLVVAAGLYLVSGQGFTLCLFWPAVILFSAFSSLRVFKRLKRVNEFVRSFQFR